MKRKLNPDQLPLFVPESSWKPPATLPDLRGQSLSLDCETKDDGLAAEKGPGWATKQGHIVGLSAATATQQFYFPIPYFDKDNVRRWAADHIAAAPKLFFHNAHYDIGWMGTDFDITVPDEKINDTMDMAVSLEENLPGNQYGLDRCCERYGVQGKNEEKLREAAAAFGCDPKKDLWKLPFEHVGEYGEQDARSTYDLGATLLPELEREGLIEPYRVEMDIVNMVISMRRRGIRLNVDRIEQTRQKYLAVIQEHLDYLSDKIMIGREITVHDTLSPQFLARIYEAENLPIGKTAKGNVSFNKVELKRIDHWFPKTVLAIHKYNDASNKFLNEFLLGYIHNGRIHAEVHQYRSEVGGTRSYRFSYSDPPLQQMPSRDQLFSTEIRGCFMPEDGELWAVADFSQQEYRLIVHFAFLAKLAGAARAAAQYHDNPDTDFHQLVVEWTGLDRKPAKDTNFAKAFGAGIPKFALMIGKSYEEAKAIYNQYDRELPFVSKLARACQQRALDRGFVRLIDGAKAHFNQWEDSENGRRRAFAHKAMNRLIQGSAARQTKIAMRDIYRAGFLPLLQMHDDLNFSTTVEDDLKKITQLMRDATPLSIPVKVDTEWGVDWGRAQKSDGYGATFEEAIKELNG